MVNDVIRRADVLLLVLDARVPELTRNREIERKVDRAGKKLIYVINKCDLIGKEISEKHKKKYNPSVFVSSTQHLGTTKLRERILIEAKRIGKERVVVGVLGYPNCGKSSVINALKGKGSAKTSSVSGYTRGIQLVKADNKIMLLDTPGVIPFREDDDLKHVLIGTKMFDKVKDPDIYAMELIKFCKGLIETHYDIKAKDEYEALEKIAFKFNKLVKGGEPNIELISRMILKDWQQGKIRLS